MKILDAGEGSYGECVNFVDENDVFVGYSLGQDCCEHAGWFIAHEIEPYSYKEEYDNRDIPDVEGYSFDKEFFQEVESGDLDSGGMVVFRMTSKGLPDLFLHLFNAHNGYYGHGFKVKHGGETVKDDYL